MFHFLLFSGNMDKVVQLLKATQDGAITPRLCSSASIVPLLIVCQHAGFTLFLVFINFALFNVISLSRKT